MSKHVVEGILVIATGLIVGILGGSYAEQSMACWMVMCMFKLMDIERALLEQREP